MAAPPAVQNTSEILRKLCKTTRLKHNKSVHENRERLVISTEDELSIFFRHQNLFVVFRHRDGALAILDDVDFKQRNPLVISCGMKYDNFVGIKLILSYAVILRNWKSKSQPKIKLQRHDLVLIISWLLGDHCIGITKELEVQQFPKKIVKLITKPRNFMTEGMMLMVKSDAGEVFKLFKSPKTVFGWQTKRGVHRHLGQFQELGPEDLSIHFSSQEKKDTSPRIYERGPEDDRDEEEYLETARGQDASSEYERKIRLPKKTSSLDLKGNQPPPLPERIPPQSAPPLSTPQEFEDSYDTVPATGGPTSCTDPELLDGSFQDTGTYQNTEVGEDPSDMEQPRSKYPLSESAEATADQGEMKRDHWFKGRMSREKAEQLLTHEGDYLFRYRGGHSNNIVLSHRIEMDRVDHLEVIKNLTSNTETLHQLTPLIEKHILHFARSNGMRFQDDQPIRLGGGPKEKEYLTFDSAYANKNPTSFKTSFEHLGDVDPYYNHPEQEDAQYEEISQRYGNEQVTPDLCETVADHLPEKNLVDFGIILGIPQNKRRSILETEDSVQERISRLMGVWLDREGSDATVQVLLDALRRLECEEIERLLQDLSHTLRV